MIVVDLTLSHSVKFEDNQENKMLKLEIESLIKKAKRLGCQVKAHRSSAPPFIRLSIFKSDASVDIDFETSQGMAVMISASSGKYKASGHKNDFRSVILYADSELR